ncbi:DinB family protein [Marinigracilibium pacificum]|uniref:DinB family protein n=1 Tax=Marinigracilibium pacificum TaxID=2729599 RepID=A0A848IZX8_9BACT|nr:DinB family protein [Marinigracilibium pacificum]NMM47850.1 DinB family protein [Marinigracilibium pacificum]
MSLIKEYKELRFQLVKLLDWEGAHVNFETAIKGIPSGMRYIKHENYPYSIWELIEHMRISQFDILDFCINPDYKEMAWPDKYWPSDSNPKYENEWGKSIERFNDDLQMIKDLAQNSKIDLFTKIPHGDGQTYLREILLVADHNAYHVGQIVLLRKILGIWN